MTGIIGCVTACPANTYLPNSAGTCKKCEDYMVKITLKLLIFSNFARNAKPGLNAWNAMQLQYLKMISLVVFLLAPGF